MVLVDELHLAPELPQRAGGKAGNVGIANQNVSAACLLEPCDGADGRGLAEPDSPDDRMCAALTHRKGNTIHGRKRFLPVNRNRSSAR